jgi:hypothetical protein
MITDALAWLARPLLYGVALAGLALLACWLVLDDDGCGGDP